MAEARKTVTVVFTDVSGSTELGERLDPEAVRLVMERFFAEARSVLERHGGTVEKFIGDAVMAVFGIPAAHEDDPLRAVRAAADLRAALPRVNEDLERERGVNLAVRAGVNTGEVVAGDAVSGEFYATGDAVNVAARLEQAAEPGEILLGVQTYRRVRDAVHVEEVGPLVLKGKSHALAAYRLVEVIEGAPAVARRFDTPFVGREEELAELLACFDRSVAKRAPVLATVLGSAGIGKTRLAAELTAQLAEQAIVLRGRCLSYGQGITFWPLAEVVKAASGIGETETPEKALAKLAALLPDDSLNALVVERVASAIALGEGSGAIEETFWAVRKVFEALAGERPLAVVFDDIQWAEPTFLDLLEYLATSTRDLPLLLLCLARPELLELRPAWSSPSEGTTLVTLDPLAEPECELLVRNLLGEPEFPQDLPLRMTEAAEGNPLFLEEIVRMLADEGLLRRENGRWSATGDLTAIMIPPTIEALLAARLDRLAPLERATIERASVIGKRFSSEAVSELSPDEQRPAVTSNLEMLVRKRLIRPEPSSIANGDAFGFAHILIRDAAYASIPKALRAKLHERFGTWLEEKASTRVGELEAILGYHFERAYHYWAELGPVDEHGRKLARRAGELLGMAGRRALKAGDASATVSLLERALTLLSPGDSVRIELVPDLATAIFVVSAIDRADTLVDEAIESARASGNQSPEWHAVVARDRVRLYADPDRVDLDEVRQNARRAIEVFGRLADDLGLARAWALLADADWMRGRAARAAKDAERAAAHARRAGSYLEEGFGLGYLAWALVYGPEPVAEGHHRCQELLLRAKGNREAECTLLGCLAVHEAMLGHFAEAREFVARAIAITQDLGMKGALGQQTLLAGEIELLAGDPATAETMMREAAEVFHAIGDRWFLSAAAVRLPRAIYAQERYDEALGLTETFEEAPAGRDIEWQIRRRGIRARVLARNGPMDEAATLAREAVAFARQTDFLNFHAEALVDLAEVLSLKPQVTKSTQYLEKALELYEQKGNIVSAENVRGLLAERAT
jgi:predicted ATPase/class 3 adenylate cyclase